jgi:3-phenylpropionate/trans-cinnamate dioxygenase ferredoxin subunit
LKGLDVASAAELTRRRRLVVAPPGLDTTVLLLRTWRGVYAVENRCPHRGAPLVGARINHFARTITCPSHGRRFDLRSGRCVSSSATMPVRIFTAWIADGRVLLSPHPAPSQPSPKGPGGP